MQAETEWPYDQTTRRFLEYAYRGNDLDDRVLVGVVVEVAVLIVSVSGDRHLA